MTYRALIPVKKLSEAKSRLAPYLTQQQRAHLVLEMLYHVVQTLQKSHLLESVVVVSQDPQVLQRVGDWGAVAREEEATGHNPALHLAALRELHTGATALLTISADLPFLQVSHIHDIIIQSQQYPVVLAASEDYTGTNALLVRPPLALPYLFGPHSLQRYLTEAYTRHLESIVYCSPGTGRDIDMLDDLHLLQADHLWQQKSSFTAQHEHYVCPSSPL